MCTCASCKYTDSFADKGFAAWPRGNPAGRKSAADYAAHARHVSTWYAAKGAEKEFPGGVPTTPLRYQTPRQRDPGADRKYPEHSDSPEGWTSTAAYVEAFVSFNNYAKEARPDRSERARPHAPGKAREHLPELDRQREPGKIYAMPKEKRKRPVGRPAMPGRRVVIKLEERHITAARKLGADNVAEGIRKALEKAA